MLIIRLDEVLELLHEMRLVVVARPSGGAFARKNKTLAVVLAMCTMAHRAPPRNVVAANSGRSISKRSSPGCDTEVLRKRNQTWTFGRSEDHDCLSLTSHPPGTQSNAQPCSCAPSISLAPRQVGVSMHSHWINLFSTSAPDPLPKPPFSQIRLGV